MKLGVYKNYRICNCCGIKFPLTREYFKRNVSHDKDCFHKKCRSCEIEERRLIEWKDGKLLCHKCKEFKPETCFTQNNSKNKTRNNRKLICRECDAKRQKNLDINLPDDKKLIKCLRFRFLGAKDRATKHNIQFNLDLDFLIDLWNKQNGLCSLSGIKMTFELRMGRTPTNLSIDRKDKNLGYTKDNIQLVCMVCNQIKSDLSEYEMYNFCKKIVEHYENTNNI